MCLVIGTLLYTVYFDFPWLLWLGFTPHNYYTLDYFPLLPWFGFVLLGIFVGSRLYAGNERRFGLTVGGDNRAVEGLRYLGRRSLLIYFVHQPVIIAVLLGLGVVDLGAF